MIYLYFKDLLDNTNLSKDFQNKEKKVLTEKFNFTLNVLDSKGESHTLEGKSLSAIKASYEIFKFLDKIEREQEEFLLKNERIAELEKELKKLKENK